MVFRKVLLVLARMRKFPENLQNPTALQPSAIHQADSLVRHSISVPPLMKSSLRQPQSESRLADRVFAALLCPLAVAHVERPGLCTNTITLDAAIRNEAPHLVILRPVFFCRLGDGLGELQPVLLPENATLYAQRQDAG